MKTTLTAAALTALSLSACQEPTTPITSTPPPRAAIVASTPKQPLFVDAGALSQLQTPPPVIDPLGLPAEVKGVDHLDKARTLDADGDLKGALTEARKALGEEPNDVDALTLVTKLAPRLKQHGLAALAYGRLAEQSPDDAVPLIRQTRALIDAHDFSEATKVGRAAVKLDPQNPEGWHALGRAHLSANDLPSAIIAFEKTVELQPKHGYALNNLGLAYLRANENAAARQVLERAVEVLPHLAYVHNNLGVALERLGETSLAQGEYLVATDLSPKYVKARINADRVAKAPTALPFEGDGDVTPEPTPEPGDDVHPMQ